MLGNMTERTDKPEDESPDSAAPGPMAGERLANARREQQIAVVEIAKELHLDEYKVRALERNDFDIIGAPVFAKGHLRKYAQLVQVSQDDVMSDYYQLERSSGVLPVVTARRRPRREISPLPWVVALAVITIVAAAYWWFVSRDSVAANTDAPDAVAPAQQSVDVANDAIVNEFLDDVVADAADEVAAIKELAATDTEADASDAQLGLSVALPDDAEAVVAVHQLALSVSYSGDCWTEITDANGRRLFFGLGSNGRSVNLSGAAPFNVLFGNAANVSLAVNGEPFEIPAASRRGRTAKLTITGT
jgi:cytoskeleton protein RodZ